MIIINIWYFITNVIYINTDRNYIFIEKSCWNTMVHLIWKKRKPKLDELQRFKQMCYDVYLDFTISGRVDHKTFNDAIKSYQVQQFDFDSINVVTITNAEVKVNDETTFIKEEYLDDTSKPQLNEEQLDHIIKLNNNLEHYEEEVKLFINHQKSTSVHFDALFNVVGFGRILSIFRILLQTGEIKLHNIYEFRIVELAFYYGLHQHIINTTSYTHNKCDDYCKLHFRYFVLCEDCFSVNRHKYIDKDKNIPISDRTCKNYTWFGKQGKMIENEFTTFTYRNFQISNYNIDKNSNVDYYAVLHNQFNDKVKAKLVEEDQILNSLIKKQVEDRTFSGFTLNKEAIDRKEKLSTYTKKQEVFNAPSSFSSFSPTETLTDNISDSDFLNALPSPLFSNNNNKSVTFEAGDICPDCETEFVRMFGSIKCICRTISTSFSGSKFSFITK